MTRRRIGLLGVPIDLGGNHRGVDMGPTALRVAGLQAGLERLGFDVEDLGDVAVPNCETLSVGDPKARFLKEIADVSERLAKRVLADLQKDRQVVVLGGDHSAALGSVTSVRTRVFRKSKPRRTFLRTLSDPPSGRAPGHHGTTDRQIRPARPAPPRGGARGARGG